MKICFTASNVDNASSAFNALTKIYGQTQIDEAEMIVALGGDGFMLQTIHANMDRKIPIYGMNRGTVGFLMNAYKEDQLIERIRAASRGIIHPLRMIATDQYGETFEHLAINEVSLFRQSHQAAKIGISVDGNTRLEELVCDGVMVATPAGSTAYNLSAQGPIIPIEAPLLAITPVSPFRPRRWRGALLPNRVKIDFDILEPVKRPVNAVADHDEVKSVVKVSVSEARDKTGIILFDAAHGWDERILAEQFQV